MNSLRERSFEVCALLNAVMVRHRERRYGEASDLTGRAAAIISEATAEIDRRLKSLGNLIRVSPSPTSPRVLCVDDNPDVADTEAELLRIVGLETRPCYSGTSALAEAVQFRPTPCLLDLDMPGMDGDELAIRLRAQFSAWPVKLVAVTARDDERSCERIKAAGFDMHLVKPVNPHMLLALVDQLLRCPGCSAAC